MPRFLRRPDFGRGDALTVAVGGLARPARSTPNATPGTVALAATAGRRIDADRELGPSAATGGVATAAIWRSWRPGATQFLDLAASDLTRAWPEREADATYPFWLRRAERSVFSHGQLKRIDIDGGPARSLTAARLGTGGAWSADDNHPVRAGAGQRRSRSRPPTDVAVGGEPIDAAVRLRRKQDGIVGAPCTQCRGGPPRENAPGRRRCRALQLAMAEKPDRRLDATRTDSSRPPFREGFGPYSRQSDAARLRDASTPVATNTR